MYILGIHTGHDAAACLYRDEELVAYIKEERLSRIKNQGGLFNLKAINEVLKIAGIDRADIDAVALTRLHLPASAYKATGLDFKGLRRKFLKPNKNIRLGSFLLKNKTVDAEKYIDLNKLRSLLGVRKDTVIHFSNHQPQWST